MGSGAWLRLLLALGALWGMWVFLPDFGVDFLGAFSWILGFFWAALRGFRTLGWRSSGWDVRSIPKTLREGGRVKSDGKKFSWKSEGFGQILVGF